MKAKGFVCHSAFIIPPSSFMMAAHVEKIVGDAVAGCAEEHAALEHMAGGAAFYGDGGRDCRGCARACAVVAA
jgi:hypothetical protein